MLKCRYMRVILLIVLVVSPLGLEGQQPPSRALSGTPAPIATVDTPYNALVND